MIWDFQDALSRRLLLWAALSIAAGAALWLFGGPFWRGFGLQAAVWGGIDAAIALFGQRSARKRQAAAAPGPETTAAEARSLRRLLWINTGLDVLYVAGGLLLAFTLGRSDPFAAGSGWGIVLQGAFLFGLDLLHARGVPTADPPMPPVDLFGGPEHAPFRLAGGRPAALLVHGFGGTPAEMRGLAEALNREGWTAQAVLLPGFGADMPTLFRRRAGEWTAAVADAAAALRQAGHGPLMLVGYSMGATASLAAGAVKPDAMILIAPFWWPEKPAFRLAEFFVRPFLPLGFRPLRKADFGSPQLRQGIGKFMPGIDLDDPATQAAMRDFRMPLGLIDQVRAISRAALAGAAHAAAPILVVQGARDDVVRPPQTARLVRRLPVKPRYVEVDAGHDLILPENPAWPQVEAAVIDFARRAGATPDAGNPAGSPSPA